MGNAPAARGCRTAFWGGPWPGGDDWTLVFGGVDSRRSWGRRPSARAGSADGHRLGRTTGAACLVASPWTLWRNCRHGPPAIGAAALRSRPSRQPRRRRRLSWRQRRPPPDEPDHLGGRDGCAHAGDSPANGGDRPASLWPTALGRVPCLPAPLAELSWSPSRGPTPVTGLDRRTNGSGALGASPLPSRNPPFLSRSLSPGCGRLSRVGEPDCRSTRRSPPYRSR